METKSTSNLAELQEMWGEPDWVDWELVERGQKLWIGMLGEWAFAMGQVLLLGFAIGRFAEVLFHTGYAQDAKTAFARYRDTLFAISKNTRETS